MRKEYDFSQGISNPYVRHKKNIITIQLDNATMDYFEEVSQKINMPFQEVITNYLIACASMKIEPVLNCDEICKPKMA